MGAGGIVLIIVVILAVIGIAWLLFWWLYERASKEMSFVRTGLGGEKVVMNSGAFVLPVLHNTTPVNMKTVLLDLARANEHALITRDRMRVNVTAEFFVRVRPSADAIAAAAQTLGSRTIEAEQLRPLLEGKFVDALRAVAAERDMQQLHEQRIDFVRTVREALAGAIVHNGLELESISLTGLDQASREHFNPNNAFDAEGLTKLTAEIETRRPGAQRDRAGRRGRDSGEEPRSGAPQARDREAGGARAPAAAEGDRAPAGAAEVGDRGRRGGARPARGGIAGQCAGADRADADHLRAHRQRGTSRFPSRKCGSMRSPAMPPSSWPGSNGTSRWPNARRTSRAPRPRRRRRARRPFGRARPSPPCARWNAPSGRRRSSWSGRARRRNAPRSTSWSPPRRGARRPPSRRRPTTSRPRARRTGYAFSRSPRPRPRSSAPKPRTCAAQ